MIRRWRDAAKLASERSATQTGWSNLAADVDPIRTKIVATKEGGMITGEERLREFLGGLYGDVNGYEGRPTDSQVARADALSRELDDVVREFTDLTRKTLPPVNKGLESKKLEPIQIISEEEWRKSDTGGGGGVSGQFRGFRIGWGSAF